MRWVAQQLGESGLTTQRDDFTADIPGLGKRPLVNLFALAPGRSPETIVVMAHRDNSGESPGANDNASGTAALLEIARNVEVTQPAHTLLFVSTDGGAFGSIGAARFAESPELVRRLAGGGASIVAVVSLDAIGGAEPARLAFAGDSARSPSASLVATADGTVADATETIPGRPSVFAQVIDLAFPFTLNEQGPFVARGIPAVTITSGRDERPPRPETDTLEALDADQLGVLGTASQELVLALDGTAELARGTESYVYTGTRLIRGWTIQLLLFAALVPFLVAVVDLFARCRRRRVALAAGAAQPGDPSGRLDLGRDPDRGLVCRRPPARRRAAAAQPGLGRGGELAGARARRPRRSPPRSAGSSRGRGSRPAGPVDRRAKLGGHLAAMLVLAVVALVVAATSPYALLFLLPSLHAWLWLPQVPRRNFPLRVGVFLAGLVGPLVLLGSFAVRFGLGLDAPWYVLALVSVGYVAPPFLLAALVWAAAAAQVGALAFGRYAPYTGREDSARARPASGRHPPCRPRAAPRSCRGRARASRRRVGPSAGAGSARRSRRGARSRRAATETSAFACAARTIMCDSWPPSGSSDGLVALRADTGAHELVPAGVRADRRRQPAALEHRQRVGGALERGERGPDEELEGDEHGDRVPGEVEDEMVAPDAERDGLARASPPRPRRAPRRGARAGPPARGRAARPRPRPR